MTLSPGELITWRTSPYSIRLDCFVHAPAVIFAARVNAPGGVIYPVVSVPYNLVTTGVHTNIEEGMTLMIGSASGKDDYGRIRVGRTAGGVVSTGSTITVQRASQGVGDGELRVIHGAHITVLNQFRVWAVPPRITDNITYMDSDKAFNNAASFPPIPNGDPDILIVVRDGAPGVQISFGGTPAVVTNPDAGSTLTYAYTFTSACTPPTSTSANPLVTIPVNTVFYARRTVTDSVGTSAVHRALVAVVDENHPNLIKKIRVTAHSERPEGQEIALEVEEALSTAVYPDGTEILIAKRERFGTTNDNLSGAPGRRHMLFAGWLYEEENTGEADEYGFTFRTALIAYDAAKILNTLPGFPVLIERDGNPSRWEQMKAANIDRYVHRILTAYSNVLTRTVFTWTNTGDTYAFSALGSDGGSLYQQADQRAQAIGCKLTCDRNGRLAMRFDPILLAEANRTSTVIVTITEDDWKEYRFRYARPPRAHWNWGEAVLVTTFDADTLSEIPTAFCLAPGEAPGQGLNEERSGQQLVVSQNELNVREGHRYAARMNNTFGYIEVSVRGGDAGVQPALMQWVRLIISSETAASRGRTFNAVNDRFLPVEVTYEYDHDSQTRSVRLTLEKETFGTPAVTYVPPRDEGGIITFPPPPPVNPLPDIIPGSVRAGTGRLAGATTDGFFLYTLSFDTPSHAGGPHWFRDALAVDGAIIDSMQDPYNLNRYFIVTTTKLYEYLNPLTSRTLNELYTFVESTATGTRNRTMESSFGAPYYVVLSGYGNSSTHPGTYITDTTNAAVWGSERLVRAQFETGGGAFYPGGIALSSRRPGNGVISAVTVTGAGSTAEASMFAVSNFGASISAVSTPSGYAPGDVASNCIHIPFDQTGDDIVFFNFFSYADDPNNLQQRKRVSGTSVLSNISPVKSGFRLAARRHRSMHSCPIDKRVVAMVASNNGVTVSGVFAARDGAQSAASWTEITTGMTTSYQGVEVSGNSPDFIYLFGGSGSVGAARWNGLSWAVDDRRGNIPTDYPGTGRFTRIYGV